MDEARAVLARLDRIEAMDRRGEPKAALLCELNLLISEAQGWLAAERGAPGRAAAAVERCERALESAESSAVRPAA